MIVIFMTLQSSTTNFNTVLQRSRSQRQKHLGLMKVIMWLCCANIDPI